MPDDIGAQEIIDAQESNTNALVQAITQFFSDPQRLQELSSVPQAMADQSFNAVTGQFRTAGQQTGFDLARRGLRGSSVEQERLGDLNTGFNRATANIAAQQQAQENQARMNFANQYLAQLGQAYQQDPLTSAALNSNLRGIGANTQAAQQQGQFNQQNAAMAEFNNAQTSQALGNPVNLYAEILRGRAQ